MKTHKHCYRTVVTAALFLASSAAGAQTVAEDQNNDAGQITVTARKSSETLQNVPEAISVVTADQIAKAGVRTITNIAALTPNLTFDPQPVPGALNFSVRGISMAQGAEAPVAFVIDGVSLPDPIFMVQNLLDSQQVEVLRGPQGSLYGRNALAGAINITTKAPTNNFSGGATFRYGNGDDRYASANLSGPIVKDKLFFSVSGDYDRFDGLLKNSFLDKNWDPRKDYDLRGRLLFKATDDLTFDLRAGYSHYVDGSEGGETVPTAQFDNYKTSFVQQNAPITSTIKLLDVALKTDLDLGSVALTSISDISRARSLFFGDADFTPAPIVLQIDRRPVNTWSQELRLASEPDPSASLNWLVGAFYQDRKLLNSLVVPFDNGNGQPEAANVLASHDQQRSRNWALFGQGTYKILPKLEATVGLRYDHDKRTSVDADAPGSAAGDTFKQLQPKISLEYHLSGDAQVYASAARGFRSGGFNSYYSAGTAGREFGAQVDDNYEIGTKFSLLDRKVFVTADAFRTQIKNQQLFFINLFPPSQNIVVIDRAHVNGGELTLSARPVKGLDINFNLGVSDVRIDRFAGHPSDKGNRGPIAPPYTAGINADYTYDLGEDSRLVGHVGWSRKGKIYWDPENTLSTPPKDLVDLRLSFEKNIFRITGFVQNLLNQQYPVQALANADGPGLNSRAISEPRTYGVEVGVKF